MEEDLPSCARLRRGAGFSHCGRGASLGPRRLDRQGFGALYVSERGCKKELLMPRTWGGVASGRHQLKPADIHEPFEKRFGPHVESSPVRDLSTASAPRTPRGRALADSKDQRRLSNATASHLVGSLKQTIDVVCAEPGKQDAEMPSRRRIQHQLFRSGGASAPRGAASPPPFDSGGASAPRGAASPPTSLFSWRICLKVFLRRAA